MSLFVQGILMADSRARRIFMYSKTFESWTSSFFILQLSRTTRSWMVSCRPVWTPSRAASPPAWSTLVSLWTSTKIIIPVGSTRRPQRVILWWLPPTSFIFEWIHNALPQVDPLIYAKMGQSWICIVPLQSAGGWVILCQYWIIYEMIMNQNRHDSVDWNVNCKFNFRNFWCFMVLKICCITWLQAL